MNSSLLNRILFGFILLLAGLQLSAATFYNGTLTGTLLDADTQEPIPHANVVLLRTSDHAYVRHVTTSADGSFRLDKVPFGRYTFTTTVLGYEPLQPTITFNGLKTRVALGKVVMQPANSRLAHKSVVAPAITSISKNCQPTVVAIN
ncbi:MAG TPA: carboxypeptidase regulatory-like domain-containing protein [Hymenobacter sp.]